MGKLTNLLPFLACGCVLLVAHAQNAPAPVTAPSQAEEDKEPFVAKQLRYVAEENADEFVNSISQSFGIANRDFDPFGLPQDPDHKPATPQPVEAAPSDAVPAIPFSEIINRIQITTVISSEQKFLVGARSFAVGDKFPLNFDGQTLWIEVTEVSARQVQFKNIQTGETAAQLLNILPPGMTPGTGGITAPGMIPAGQQAPLDLTPSSDDTEVPSR